MGEPAAAVVSKSPTAAQQSQIEKVFGQGTYEVVTDYDRGVNHQTLKNSVNQKIKEPRENGTNSNDVRPASLGNQLVRKKKSNGVYQTVGYIDKDNNFHSIYSAKGNKNRQSRDYKNNVKQRGSVSYGIGSDAPQTVTQLANAARRASARRSR